mgnify:CR=1 FL=1
MEPTYLAHDDLWNCIAFFRPNRPVLVTTCNRDGSPHVAPFAWCVPVSARPPLVSLALLSSPRKQHSLVNIERDRQFVVNFPGFELSADLVRSSYRYPTGVYKAGILGFKFAASRSLEVPALEQCRARIECRLVDALKTGDHTLLIGEVVDAAYADVQYDAGFILKASQYPPCLHLGHVTNAAGQVHTFMRGSELVQISVPFNLPCPLPGPDAGESVAPANVDAERPREIADRANPSIFAHGFACPDGPTWVDEQWLYVVDWVTGMVHKIDPAGHVADVVDTHGMPAGACVGPDNEIIVCDTGRRQVVGVSPGGSQRVIAADCHGERLLGPNGCACDRYGNLYFTDADGYHPTQPNGRVLVQRPDGTTRVLVDQLTFPTKLAITPDGDTMYLSETFGPRVHRYDIDSVGHVVKRHVVTVLCGGIGPTGIAIGADGNLYVAHFGKGVVAVLNPAGDLLAQLPTGGFLPTNLVFWNGRLYVTELERGCIMCLDTVACGFSETGPKLPWQVR